MTTTSPRLTGGSEAGGGGGRRPSPTRSGGGAGLIDFIRRHRVASFFVLAYFLTWGAIPWNSFFTPGP